MELTQRQKQILKVVIEEYIETAQPVGSSTIEKKYDLDVSSATIRNEMSVLVKADYLQKPHSSAGRIPTSKGLKYYVTNLMKKQDLTVVDEVAVKEKVSGAGVEADDLLTEATRELAKRANALAVAGLEGGRLFYSGAANILDIPEFYNIDVTKTVLSMLDELDCWLKLFEPGWNSGISYNLLLGSELGYDYLNSVGFIYSPFRMRGVRGGVGVVGPCRFDYSKIIPMVEYVGFLLEEAGQKM